MPLNKNRVTKMLKKKQFGDSVNFIIIIEPFP